MPHLQLLSLLALAAATVPPFTLTPSNSSANPTTNSSSITLSLTSDDDAGHYVLEPAYMIGSPGSTLATYFTRPFSLGGNLFLGDNVTAPFGMEEFAYICCDPEAYSNTTSYTSASANSTLDAILANVTSYVAGKYAVIFYSRQSAQCTASAPSVFFSSHPNLLTLSDPATATELETYLRKRGSVAAQIQAASKVGNSNSTNNSNQGSTPSGVPPSSTVAMIILYAITGIITLCFITIISAGAVRARRHPEWYLPDDRAGRARVLGRAILDSIPIMKFGEGGRDGDIELARRKGKPTETPAPPREAPAAPADSQVAVTDTIETTPVPIAAGLAAAVLLPQDDETALACSICVEEFQRGDEMRVLPQCNHKFHPQCLDPWLLNVSSTCPLCRLDLRPSARRAAANSAAAAAAAEADEPVHPIEEGDADIWLLPTDTPGVYRRLDPAAMSREAARQERRDERRRRLARLLFSRERMREASGEERVQALRALREVVDESGTSEEVSGDAIAGGAGQAAREEEKGAVPVGEKGASGASQQPLHDGETGFGSGEEKDGGQGRDPSTSASAERVHLRGSRRLTRLFGREAVAGSEETADDPAHREGNDGGEAPVLAETGTGEDGTRGEEEVVAALKEASQAREQSNSRR